MTSSYWIQAGRPSGEPLDMLWLAVHAVATIAALNFIQSMRWIMNPIAAGWNTAAVTGRMNVATWNAISAWSGHEVRADPTCLLGAHVFHILLDSHSRQNSKNSKSTTIQSFIQARELVSQSTNTQLFTAKKERWREAMNFCGCRHKLRMQDIHVKEQALVKCYHLGTAEH